MLALYRKYRPQKLSEICGQNHIKLTLKNELETNRLAHAYLFSGPRGTGKTTIARILARALNCEKRKTGEPDPCGKCGSCLSIAEGRSLDVIEIDAASHTGVDNVRENIIQTAKYSPSSSRHKIFIIDEVHMLSASAFNALLKTLEEPPAHAFFILATTELYKVPETILSRCQRFEFHKVGLEDLLERLNLLAKKEKISVDDAVLELVARRAEGSVRDAESLLGQIFSLDEKKITLEMARLVIPYSDLSMVLEFLRFLVSGSVQEAIQYINRIIYNGVDLERFTHDSIEVLRKALLIQLGVKNLEGEFHLPKDQAEELARLSRLLSAKKLVFMMENLMKKQSEFRESPILQLPLEMAAVEISLFEERQAEKPVAFDKKSASPTQPDEPARPINPVPKPPLAKPAAPVSPLAEKDVSPAQPVDPAEVLKKINEQWTRILERVKEHNHTLSSFLQTMKPVGVKNNRLQLGVSYTIHKERIDELKNKMVVETIMTELTGMRIRIESILIEKQPVQGDEPELEALAQEFGGSVAE